MALDANMGLQSYHNIIKSCRPRVKSVQQTLMEEFNYGISADQTNYVDFWKDIYETYNLTDITYDDIITTIVSNTQASANILESNFMNILGMVDMLDKYMCNITDSFSRIVDTVWSTASGAACLSKTGIQYEDGSFEIVKKGVQWYTNIMTNTLNDLESYVRELDRSKGSDNNYLNSIHPVIMSHVSTINDALLQVEDELVLLEELSIDAKDALEKWIKNCFQMVTTVSLAFNIGKKAAVIAQKCVTGNPEATSAIIQIGVSIGLAWKELLKPDRSNQQECTNGAILQGLNAIGDMGFLDAFIEKSWDAQIPKM